MCLYSVTPAPKCLDQPLQLAASRVPPLPLKPGLTVRMQSAVWQSFVPTPVQVIAISEQLTGPHFSMAS